MLRVASCAHIHTKDTILEGDPQSPLSTHPMSSDYHIHGDIGWVEFQYGKGYGQPWDVGCIGGLGGPQYTPLTGVPTSQGYYQQR